VVSDNDTSAADDMDRVGRHEVGFVFVHPSVQLYILSFGMVQSEAMEADEFMKEAKVAAAEVDPDGAGFALFTFLDHLRQKSLEAAILEHLLGGDVDGIVAVSPQVDCLLDLGKAAERSF